MFAFLPASRLARHLLFWLAMMGYFLVPQFIYPDYLHTVGHYFFGFTFRQSPYFLGILFAYTFGVGVLYTYAVRWGVLPSLLAARLGRGLGVLGLATLAACYLFRLLCAGHVALLDPWLRHQPSHPLDGRFFQGWFFNQVYINEYTTLILLVTSYKFLENWQHKQQDALRLLREKLQTEIQLVKAQLNPHFLLGSLATLGYLLDERAPQAPAVVLTLSHFLSYVLYESQADQVPLARELAAFRQYISLEQARLGDELDVSLTITGEVAGQTIAPLLLLPLLENAFKHGLATPEQAWLSVQLAVSGPVLKLSLANSVDPARPPTFAAGAGLHTLRQRLAARYPERHELRLAPEPGVFVAVLTLQLAAPSLATDSLIQFPYEIALPVN